MYHKAMFFGDQEIAKKIMATKEPKKQKGFGRKVANFDAKMWDLEKSRVVEEGNYHKFMHSLVQRENLKAMLLATGDRALVEASPFDRVWGIGYKAEDAEANKPYWGDNLLGKALEATRGKIREEEAAAKS